jgi:hypothetical protein
MRLPVKFLPRQSQHIGNAVGAVVIIIFGLAFMSNYLPDGTAAGNLTFGEWLSASGVRLPFLVLASLVPLFGLTALTVALVNLLSGSPFHHMIVDRFGIRSRTFFGEKHFSWKELGPIRPLRLSALRAFGLDRRFWIISDTFSGEARNDTRRPLSTFNLRIPVASYLGSSWLGGDVEPAMNATAAWLDSLRKLAREEALTSDDAPDAPDALGQGLPIERPAEKPVQQSVEKPAAALKTAAATATDLPPMEDRKFGRRDGPTVER